MEDALARAMGLPLKKKKLVKKGRAKGKSGKADSSSSSKLRGEGQKRSAELASVEAFLSWADKNDSSGGSGDDTAGMHKQIRTLWQSEGEGVRPNPSGKKGKKRQRQLLTSECPPRPLLKISSVLPQHVAEGAHYILNNAPTSCWEVASTSTDKGVAKFGAGL